MGEAVRKRGGAWIWGVLLAIAGVLWLVFKLYEPFIVGPFGWKPLPEGPYPATSRVAEGWDEAGERADAWLTTARERLGAPALSAAVSVDGELVWAGVIGYADIEKGIEATTDTVFRIGSSSKAVTAVAVGTLIAEGAIDLDAPVSTYMPDLGEPLATVTTRQAMSHTAGVRDYGTCLCFPALEYFNRKHYETRRDALRPYERSPLLFEPGEGFSYTSFGYNVVGGVVESVTGKPFGVFLDDAVLAPLGMRSTRADAGRPESADATFYDTSRPGRYKEVFRVDNTNKQPAGGILSTPSDMVRLGQQMLAPTLLDPATRDLLMPPGVGRELYGLGWRYQKETEFMDGTTPRLHHHGRALGASSNFTVYPEYAMVVSVMESTMERPPERGLGGHADALAGIFAAELEEARGAAASD